MPGNPSVGIYRDTASLQPLVFGVSDVLIEQVFDLNLPAGLAVVDFTAVPAGYVYCITDVSMRYVGTIPLLLTMGIYDGTNYYPLFGVLNGTSNNIYTKAVQWLLKPGWVVRVQMANATVNNDIFAYLNGYKMKTGVA